MTEKRVTRTAQKAIVSAILKEARAGEYLPRGQTLTIIALAKAVGRYATAAAHESARVMVKQHRKFRVKTLYLVTDSHNIPMLVGHLSTSGIEETKISKPTNRSVVMRTCREIISEQITEWAHNFWESTKHMKPGPKCPASGKSLRANRTAVDHVYPFVKLVEDWAQTLGLDIAVLPSKGSKKLKRRTFNQELDKSWAEYHKKHALLDMLTATANMQKGARITQTQK